MGIIVIFVLAIGGVFGLVALFASNKRDPSERAAEVVGAAAGGAMMAGGCVLQLMVAGLMALAGLWLLSTVFGH